MHVILVPITGTSTAIRGVPGLLSVSQIRSQAQRAVPSGVLSLRVVRHITCCVRNTVRADAF